MSRVVPRSIWVLNVVFLSFHLIANRRVDLIEGHSVSYLCKEDNIQTITCYRVNLVNFTFDFILKYIVFCVILILTLCYCVNWRLKGCKISSIPIPSLPLSVLRLLIFGNILLAFLSTPCVYIPPGPSVRPSLNFCRIVCFTLFYSEAIKNYVSILLYECRAFTLRFPVTFLSRGMWFLSNTLDDLSAPFDLGMGSTLSFPDLNRLEGQVLNPFNHCPSVVFLLPRCPYATNHQCA